MKILIAECMQEISSFNPLPSRYEDFRIEAGAALLARRGLNTSIGGALSVFDRRADVDILPAISLCPPFQATPIPPSSSDMILLLIR